MGKNYFEKIDITPNVFSKRNNYIIHFFHHSFAYSSLFSISKFFFVCLFIYNREVLTFQYSVPIVQERDISHHDYSTFEKLSYSPKYTSSLRFQDAVLSSETGVSNSLPVSVYRERKPPDSFAVELIYAKSSNKHRVSR